MNNGQEFNSAQRKICRTTIWRWVYPSASAVDRTLSQVARRSTGRTISRFAHTSVIISERRIKWQYPLLIDITSLTWNVTSASSCSLQWEAWGDTCKQTIHTRQLDHLNSIENLIAANIYSRLWQNPIKLDLQVPEPANLPVFASCALRSRRQKLCLNWKTLQ